MAQSFSNNLPKNKSLSQTVGSINPNQAWKDIGSKYKVSKTFGLERKGSGMAFPSLTALGGVPKSTSPMPRTGTSATPVSSPQVSTGTPQYSSSGAGIQGQIDGIRNGIAGAQSLLDQRKAAETAPSLGRKNVASDGTTSFRGILDSILGASKVTKEQERTRKEMERIAAGNKAIGDEAKRVSDMYGQEIARVGTLGAGAVAGNLSTGSNVVGSGNAAIASQSASQRMNALGTAQAAALKGTEQQLTAQEQQANAFNPSLQASLTQQQQQLSGLGTAGGLAQPVQVPYSNQFIDPMSGQSAGGAGLGGYAGYNAAQQAIALAGEYPDAGVQYDANLSPEQNLQRIQQAIQGSATYQRGAFGAAGANSYIGGQQLSAAGTLTQQVSQLQTQGNAADANFNLMLDILKRGGINDLNQPVLNQLQQGLSRGLTSDADLIAFRSALQTVRSQYAAILGGGTPTDATQAMAAEKIPDTVSAGALQEVERTMKSLVSNTVASYNQQIGSYSNQGGGSGGGGAVTWDMILDN